MKISKKYKCGWCKFEFIQEGKKVFDYDIYECPSELQGQLKIGDFLR